MCIRDSYHDIAQRLSETKRERSRYINEFIRPLREKLEQSALNFEIYGRPKSIHSIWNKMKKKGVTFDEVYDLFAIRVILHSPPEQEQADCWKVYSVEMCIRDRLLLAKFQTEIINTLHLYPSTSLTGRVHPTTRLQ